MELLNSIPQLRADKKYVRIRTDYGNNFDTFFENKFVAIGYNYIGSGRLKEENETTLRQMIASNEKWTDKTPGNKQKISRAYNMLFEFKSLRQGDVIIIPDQNSDRVAFGEIIDNDIFQAIEGSLDCDYIKRRKVRWLKLADWDELDPSLRPLKVRGHTINFFDHLSDEIDKVMRYLFVKNNRAHFVIDIDKEDNIPLVNLLQLLEGIKDLSLKIIDHYNLDENIEDITIKLNVKSDGLTELIKSGKSLLVVAAMITVASCGDGASGLEQNDEQEIMNLNDEFADELETIVSSFDSLEVPQESRHFFKQ